MYVTVTKYCNLTRLCTHPDTLTFYPFPKQALVYICLLYKSFENTVGKGEIAHNEQFVLFRQCFLSICRTLHHFQQIQNCCLQTLSVWRILKFVVWERVNRIKTRGIEPLTAQCNTAFRT